MGLEFRHRDYKAETQAHKLPRTRVEFHPLSASSTSQFQVRSSSFFDEYCFHYLFQLMDTVQNAINTMLCVRRIEYVAVLEVRSD